MVLLAFVPQVCRTTSVQMRFISSDGIWPHLPSNREPLMPLMSALANRSSIESAAVVLQHGDWKTA